MPVKIRLQRHGRKGKPFYHIVVADSRAPRDGKFIEKIGIYNPLTNPATIDLNLEQAVTWLKNGAQPTDTTRAILSYKGALYKAHLDGGVTKGALSAEEAETRFKTWLEARENKISDKRQSLSTVKADAEKARLAEETRIKEERSKALAARKAEAEALASAAHAASTETQPAEAAEGVTGAEATEAAGESAEA